MKKVWVVEEYIKKNDLDSNDVKKKTCEKPAEIFGIRHLQVLLLFLCLTIAYALRVNLSVAIVAMTDRNSANPDFEEYDWNEHKKSIILSSFFWGYVVTQIPAGQLAERYGAKLLLLVAMIVCSTLTMLTPIFASIGGWKLICALRVVEGFFQGVIFPSTHSLLSKWAPLSERAKLVTYCYAGSQFGTVIMLSTSGLLASSVMGWPGIFYLSGTAGGLWVILYMIFGSNSPAESQSISTEEREFIQSSYENNSDDPERKIPTPWKSIFTSIPFLSLIVVHSAHNWGFWTLLTEMPTYMKSILGLDIKQNALLSAMPYLTMLILSFCFSFISDILQERNCIPLIYSRKIFNTIGHWIPMCALIALGYVTKDDRNLAIGLLTLAVGLNAATYLGFQCNHIDLAQNHAGTLMGITNCAANIMSIIAPLLVGEVVTDETDPSQWRIVFFIAAGIYFIGNLSFIIFGKVNTQSWNNLQRPSNEEEGAIAQAQEPNNRRRS